MSLQEFFHMGGYGFYIWTSYALALIVLMANVIRPWTWRRRILRELGQRQQTIGGNR